VEKNCLEVQIEALGSKGRKWTYIKSRCWSHTEEGSKNGAEEWDDEDVEWGSERENFRKIVMFGEPVLSARARIHCLSPFSTQGHFPRSSLKRRCSFLRFLNAHLSLSYFSSFNSYMRVSIFPCCNRIL